MRELDDGRELLPKAFICEGKLKELILNYVIAQGLLR